MSPRVPPPRVAAPRPEGGARRVVGWLLVGGLVGLLVAVVLPTGLAAWSMSAWFTSQDAGRFDQVEARLAGGAGVVRGGVRPGARVGVAG